MSASPKVVELVVAKKPKRDRRRPRSGHMTPSRRPNSRSRERSASSRRSNSKGRAPMRALIAPRIKELRPKVGNSMGHFLKALTLPAEGQPQRLTDNGGYPTVVQKYTDAPAILQGSASVGPYLGDQAPPTNSFLFIMTRQPSRQLGVSPGYVGASLNQRTEKLVFTAFSYTSWTSPPGPPVDAMTPGYTSYWAHPQFSLATGEQVYRAYFKKSVPDATFTFQGAEVSLAGCLSTASEGGLTIASHVATDGEHTFFWLNKSDQVTFSIIYTYTVNNGPVLGIIRTPVQLWRADEDAGQEAPSLSSILTMNTQLTPTSGTTGPGYTEGNLTLVPSNPGYFRIVLGAATLSPLASPNVPDGDQYNITLTGVKLQVSIFRAESAVRWYNTPEMLQQTPLYQEARVSSAAVLISNRTPQMYRGGNIYAGAFPNHDSWFAAYGDFNKFKAKSSMRPHGYTGDLSTGLYTWLKMGKDDCLPTTWVTDAGFPLFHLRRESTVSMALMNGPSLANAGSVALSLFVNTDLHLESAIGPYQSYGKQLTPKLTSAELERALAMTADWPVWTENPMHVPEFLRKLGTAGWSAFKFAAPHLRTLAEAALANQPALSALATLAKSVL